VIIVRGGGSSLGSAAQELTRFAHQRAMLNAALNNEVVHTGLAAPAIVSPFSNIGTVPTRGRTDQRDTWTMNPTLIAGSGHIWKGVTSTATASEMRAQMRDTVPAVEAAQPSGQAYAMVCQAWLRKANNVNPCWSRQFFGLGYFQLSPLGATAAHPRVGVMGDGNVGFRLGSVHCPDGAAAGQSTAGAADAGFIQPPALQSPGLNWFHVRVKLVPATPISPGAVGVYLDGALQVQYQTNAHFPRGQLAANQNYAQVEAAAFTDFDGATQLNGWAVSDWEVWYDTDLTL